MASTKTRLRVLELVTEIASEAAQNPNIVWAIEFQELLVERLYRKMIGLIEEDEEAEEDDAEEENEEDEEEDKEEDKKSK